MTPRITVGSNLESLGATHSCQWSQDSSLAASPAWHLPYVCCKMDIVQMKIV